MGKIKRNSPSFVASIAKIERNRRLNTARHKREKKTKAGDGEKRTYRIVQGNLVRG